MQDRKLHLRRIRNMPRRRIIESSQPAVFCLRRELTLNAISCEAQMPNALARFFLAYASFFSRTYFPGRRLSISSM